MHVVLILIMLFVIITVLIPKDPGYKIPPGYVKLKAVKRQERDMLRHLFR